MGLDVWFREDVARVLRAARVAGREAQAGPDGQIMSKRQSDYWRGYEAALATIGTAFGLSPATLCTEETQRPALPEGEWSLSDPRQPAVEQSRNLDTTGAWK